LAAGRKWSKRAALVWAAATAFEVPRSRLSFDFSTACSWPGSPAKPACISIYTRASFDKIFHKISTRLSTSNRALETARRKEVPRSSQFYKHLLFFHAKEVKRLMIFYVKNASENYIKYIYLTEKISHKPSAT